MAMQKSAGNWKVKTREHIALRARGREGEVGCSQVKRVGAGISTKI